MSFLEELKELETKILGAKEKIVITTAEDLNGKKIGVQLGTTGDIYASDYEAEGSTIERYNKGADAIQSLKQGKVDCVMEAIENGKIEIAVNFLKNSNHCVWNHNN